MMCSGSNDRLDVVIQTITGSAVDVAHFAIAFFSAAVAQSIFFCVFIYMLSSGANAWN